MFLATNNIKLHYMDVGKGFPIVFIHGLGEKAVSWHHQVKYFQQNYRVITVDLRSHCKSTNDDAVPLTMALFAKDVIALLDYLKIDKAVIIGHSMGGLVCQEIAAHYRERVQAMVLSGTAGFYPEPFCTEGLKERLNFLKTATMEDMAELVCQKCCGPDVTPAIRQEIKDLFLDNDLEQYTQATIATFKADYRPYHKDMNFPTLLIVGEFDKTTPVAYSDYLISHLPQSRIEIIPRAAHMTKVENPEGFNKALLGFLQQVV